MRLKGSCHALTQVLGPLFPPLLCQLVSLSCLLYILTKGIRRDFGHEVPLRGESASGPCPQASVTAFSISSGAQETPSGGITQGRDWARHKGHHTYIPCLVGGLSEVGAAGGDGWLLLRGGLASRGPVAGGVGPLVFTSEEGDSSCWGAGLGPTSSGGLSGSSGSCLGLVVFFMAGGVSGGVSGTRVDIGGGGGGGEGSPSGEGLGSGGVLAAITGSKTQERRESETEHLLPSVQHVALSLVQLIFIYSYVFIKFLLCARPCSRH